MQVQSNAEQLLFTTVRIETRSPKESGSGTGFIFNYRVGDQQVPVLVTNKHVVKGSDVGTFFFTLGKGGQPVIGEKIDLEVTDFEDAWHGHPDPDVDIAVMPLALIRNSIEKTGKQLFYRAITQDLVPSKDQLDELDAIEEVLFIGYPNGIYDTVNLIPIARRGITATPIQIDYEGKPKFLIDGSVFPGSSGSPVFICNTGGYTTKSGKTTLGGGRVLFLGIIAAVFYREDEGAMTLRPVPTENIPAFTTRQMIDLGVVYKFSAVLETIENFIKVRAPELLRS